MTNLILVDMDGVLADWETEYVRTHRELFPDRYISEVGTRTEFRTSEDNTLEVWAHEGLFRRMRPYAGIRQAFSEMGSELDAEIRICSSPSYKNRTCLRDKTDWLTDYVGEQYARTAIFTKDKTLVQADYLIDDNPSITGLYEPVWQHIVFDQPYNQKVVGPRIKSWDRWREGFSDLSWTIFQNDYDPCHPWSAKWGTGYDGYDVFETPEAAAEYVARQPHGPLLHD